MSRMPGPKPPATGRIPPLVRPTRQSRALITSGARFLLIPPLTLLKVLGELAMRTSPLLGENRVSPRNLFPLISVLISTLPRLR